jgi:hypothetical protein
LHIYTGKQIRHGIYLEDGELKHDGGDWEKFWGPLEAALIKGWNAEAFEGFRDSLQQSRNVQRD